MGGARWDDTQYESYATTTNYRSKSSDEIFESRALKSTLDPAKVRVNSGMNAGLLMRESVDSVENPNSTPILFGLDVTGSMGFVAVHIAKEGLGEVMSRIYEEKPVSDPHLLFMGIGDVRAGDRAPLQASQFEADIKILEQLRELWLESGGGGNSHESYDLAWYFAAHKTSTDAWNKRQSKGYVFSIGDEYPPEGPLTRDMVEKIFGAEAAGDLPANVTAAETLKAAQEKYKVFHIIAEEGSHARSYLRQTRAKWKELMGPNVIYMKNCKDLAEIVVATLRIANGEDMSQVLRESKNPSALQYAFEMQDGY